MKKIPLILIPGWSFSADIFKPVQMALAPHFYINAIDWHLMNSENHSAHSFVEKLQATIQTPCVILGWSLGGLIAMTLALHFPNKILACVTLATNPCFIKQYDWDYGVEPQWFADFKQNLQDDPDRTLNTFDALISKGSLSQTAVLRHIKQYRKQHPKLNHSQLQTTLGWFEEMKLIEEMQNITVPSLHLFADYDSLVPVAIADKIQSLNAQIEAEIVLQSSHLFFLPQNKKVAQIIQTFISQKLA